MMYYLILIVVSAAFGFLICGLCAASKRSDDLVEYCILRDKYDKVKKELHTLQTMSQPYPIEGAD